MRSVFLTYGLEILLLSSLFVTCKKDKRTDDARKIVSEWTGKQIEFPDGISCFAMGKDTDCIPTWNRQPVAPGTTTEINVEVTPDIPGVFRKTVSVYGNIENVPLQLLVIGRVTN